MNIYKYGFPILLAITSSMTNAQSMSDAELDKLLAEKFDISTFYNEEAIKLINLDNPESTDFNRVIQNFCKSNKALAEVKMIALQYPQVPREIYDKANVNYESGIKNINLLREMSPNKIECNE